MPQSAAALPDRFRDVEHLEDVIDQFAIYGQTTTSIMQKSPVPVRPLTLDGQTPARTAANRR